MMTCHVRNTVWISYLWLWSMYITRRNKQKKSTNLFYHFTIPRNMTLTKQFQVGPRLPFKLWSSFFCRFFFLVNKFLYLIIYQRQIPLIAFVLDLDVATGHGFTILENKFKIITYTSR